MEACNCKITYSLQSYLSLYYLYILLIYVEMYASVCMFRDALVFIQQSPWGAIGDMHGICRLQRSTVRHTTYAPARLDKLHRLQEGSSMQGAPSPLFSATLVGVPKKGRLGERAVSGRNKSAETACAVAKIVAKQTVREMRSERETHQRLPGARGEGQKFGATAPRGAAAPRNSNVVMTWV